MLVFLYLPIVILIVYSFNSSRLNILWEGFTLEWYAAIWQRRRAGPRRSSNSLIVAVASTVLSVVLGTGGAWLLYRYRFPGRPADRHAGLRPDDHPRGRSWA